MFMKLLGLNQLRLLFTPLQIVHNQRISCFIKKKNVSSSEKVAIRWHLGVKGQEKRPLHAVVKMQVYPILVDTLLCNAISVLRLAQWRVFPSSDQLNVDSKVLGVNIRWRNHSIMKMSLPKFERDSRWWGRANALVAWNVYALEIFL